ncbi:hypothetical protein [Chryseosolibacter indicus]|uniref:SPOR domain-containing protein n=1 Tax=Chryseosolibacter indicus TaxID=2782351 RepID=A0ABS5VRP6_9BACT|nr:hypothetical protein [Chryseosolibacter indicus]MBT1703462.1 hypothetical protein [Chryseosolibacter indicus]
MARRKKLNEEQTPPENTDNTENTDDSFGLPEIEYEPINREETSSEDPVHETTPTVEEPVYQNESRQEYKTSSAYVEDEPSSSWGKILGVLVVVALLGGAAYWFFGIYQPQKLASEKARKEQLAREEAERRAAEERLAEERRLAEQRRADSLANLKPKVGTVQTLTDRTGRYYVVVASAVDGDLIMDYANKLAPKGVNAKIIPPFGKAKFYRLAVAEGETYTETQATADGMKGGEYGNDLWVIRY